jgi:hypothetical protein
MLQKAIFLSGLFLIFFACGQVFAQDPPPEGSKIDRSKIRLQVEEPSDAPKKPTPLKGTEADRSGRELKTEDTPAPPVPGMPTKVLVRALARDAKIIYDNVGGAHFTFKDATTGRMLAEGVQKGSSGDTDLIMVKPRQRGTKVFDTPGSAGLVVTLKEPTLVEITAEGPLKFQHSMQRSSKTVLLIPGQNVLGEGIILEIHGFIVSLLNFGEEGKKINSNEPLDVRATVTMMCGCPIESKGLWDADKIRVVARLVKDGKVVEETPLLYAGEMNTFAGKIKPLPPGQYQLQVLVMDPLNANFGMTQNRLTVD